MNKDGSKIPKKKPSFLCHFAINVDEPVPKSSRMAILEGEYWKRRLSSITNEYKKWRVLSRQHLKTHEDTSKPNLNKHAVSNPTTVENSFINSHNLIVTSNTQNSNDQQLGHLTTNINNQLCNVNYINTSSQSFNHNSSSSFYDNIQPYDTNNNTIFLK